MRDSFLIFTEHYENVDELTDEQAGQVFKALLHSQLDEDVSLDDQAARITLKTILRQVQRSAEQYDKKASSGKNGAKKRWGGIANDSTAMANDSTTIAPDSTLMANDSKGIANDSTLIANDSTPMATDSTGMASDSTAMANDSKAWLPNPNPIPNPNPNPIKEKYISKEKFIPPTVEEVKDYVAEKGYNVDAEKFVAFYASKGWMIGKNKMKSWQQAVVTWEKNNRDQAQARSRPERTGNTGNKFNNFPQRKYDFEELEKQLLAVQRS